MKYKLIILILIVFRSVFAEVTLNDCIENVIKNDTNIRISNLETANKFDEKRQNLYSFLPDVSFISKTAYSTNDMKYLTNDLGISGQIALFDTRFNNLKASNYLLKQQIINNQETKNKSIREVIRLYTNLLISQKKIELYTKRIENYQDQLEIQKALQKVGQKTSLDIFSLKIEIKKTRILIEQTKSQRASDIDKLHRLTKIDKKELENLQPYEFNPQKISPANNFNNSDVHLQQLNVRLYKNYKSLYLTKFFPALFLRGTMDYAQSHNLKENYSLSQTWDKTWEVSLNFSYTIGAFKENLYSYRIYKRKLRQEKLKLDELKEEIRDKLDEQLKELKIKYEEIGMNNDILSLSADKYKLAEEKYRNGIISFLDYKNAENEFTDAKLQLLKSKYEYLLKTVDWQIATGKPILRKYK